MTTTTTMSPSVVKIHRNRANEVAVTERRAVADDVETR
jgi:hypothetical protein